MTEATRSQPGAMLPYVDPETIEAVLAKPGLYVSLPITTADEAAELFNRVLDHLQGEQECDGWAQRIVDNLNRQTQSSEWGE